MGHGFKSFVGKVLLFQFGKISRRRSNGSGNDTYNIFKNTFNIYFCVRERKRETRDGEENVRRGGAERGGQRIRSRLCADSREPDVGLEPTNYEIMT